MNYDAFEADQSQEVIELFERVFSDSEGKDEGRLIRNLVCELIETTAAPDLFGYVVTVDMRVIGCIFFSRLTIENGPTAFILSPVAIHIEYQGKGIGQRLITFGIDRLRDRVVDLIFTYGDPEFYSKTGFKQIDTNILWKKQLSS